MSATDIELCDFTRAVVLLAGALKALDAAAAREKRREQGKALRQITEQQRAEAARAFVAEMARKYGFEGGGA